MAEICVGLACSHSPQMSSPAASWHKHAERDRRNQNLFGSDGRRHSYDELEAAAPAWLAQRITPEAFATAHAKIQQAITGLGSELAASGATVSLVIGDDQRELFLDDGTPTFAIYWGSTIQNLPLTPEQLQALPPGLREAAWANHGEEVESYPVPAEFAYHVVESLVGSGFDVTQLTEQPEGRSVGHAFTFAHRRLMNGQPLPMIPVLLNAYYPPNRPTPSRCYDFGRALAAAIESWPGSDRVAVIASGGLSHMVVDEQFDRGLLAALEARDEAWLRQIPGAKLQGGTAEVLNWVAAAGVLDGLQMELLDYLPGYRSPAGTGVGLAFARWA
jgi:3-O-methylgallate 3,4-dioxygenase